MRNKHEYTRRTHKTEHEVRIQITAEHDVRIARSRRAQTSKQSEEGAGQIFSTGIMLID